MQNLEEQNYIRAKLFDKKKSNFEKYSELVIGEVSITKLIKYEFITSVFGSIPGAIGLFLRKTFYPSLFGKIGKGVVFGKNIMIRNPQKIFLGDNVIIDDYSVIDARGAGEEGIVIGSDTIINRNSSIQAKLGPIHIGSATDIGMYSVVHSQGGVRIGDMVTLGGGCKISGGMFQVDYDDEQSAESPDQINSFESREQKRFTKGPIVLGNKCIFGMGVIILDGVNIGDGCVLGAGSVITKDIPEYSVAAGVPAKVLRKRESSRQTA